MESKSALFYNTIFLIRRLLYAIVLVFLSNWPIVQCISIGIIFIPVAAYHVILRPYSSKGINIMMCLNELTLVICAGSFFFFIKPAESRNPSIVGWLVLFLIAFVMLLNFTYIWIEAIINVYLTCKNKLKKKKKDK